MKKLHIWIYLGIISLVWACSTEKNTMLSRAYHGTTAHYNGYFNANDLLEGAMKTYQENQKEDYYEVLPVLQLPSEEEVKNMYSPIDTAIAKCTKVIQRHAMPSMEKPASKKDEHNRWIDENWITIGIANYYRRDYDVAFKNFEYTKKFFSTDKSAYIAEMWMARTYMEQGKFTEANFAITNLEKEVEKLSSGDSKSEKGSKSSKSSKKKSKKKTKKEKEKEPAPFPKKLRYDVFITRAIFCENKKDVEGEIKALTKALEFAKKSKDKARINFILGQLFEKKGDRPQASYYYGRVRKYNAGYEMSFNATLKNALNAGGEKVRKNLKKMLRDTKNGEFKDQIYYTLAKMDQQDGMEENAKGNYTRSALYSISNARQKGMAYEKLGDITFAKKDYLSAQKYYDSCAKVIPENYPNYEGVKNKASKLQSLVNALEIAQYEDSVQRVASLSPSDQLAFAEGVIAKMKKDDEERKRQDAIRLAALQDVQNKKPSNGNGNKFYWNNDKAKAEGFEEFRKQWGQRNNEDDWRRSEKVVFASFTDEGDSSSTAKVEDNASTALDSLTPEMLVAKLPLSDSALQASRSRMMNAYFDAGGIYNEQLNEAALAEKQYRTMLSKEFESDMKLMAAYQIYKLHNPDDPIAIEQKDFILINYPTSDYAGYLRDPDYFIKKKEREKLTQEAYLTDLDRYERGLFYPVIQKANIVIAEEQDNPYRSKYILLKAMAQAKMNEDKRVVLPTLDTLIALYPKTPEADKAKEMKNIILNGYSANEKADFEDKSIYKYVEGETMLVLVFLTDKINNVVAKTRVVDFNKEYYGKLKLNVTSKVFKQDNVILMKQFKDEYEAASYVAMYKRTRNHLLDMQKLKILFISEKNLLTLFESGKLDEYQLFFDEKY
ncbi:hypothetical protein [Fluviicola taffensis]|uniref:Tetratricopeptide repeat protein n=1 Tax=Fluviicola taffensis (strain DSM 16823 / NCIMB 13979 / RW262) TaxID=755732 RepID=F2IAM4_FLUTR|nr:hypothetical protein [Fluviicola taffensis]AEA43160.1 hypothetical protein Fluta_1165 [Fluviicola taffensis DSM 16823]